MVEKVDTVQDQMDYFSREMETVRENQLEMLETKNIEVKIVFYGLISKVETAEESR